MSQSVHTYGEIFTTPYEFENIIDLKITREINEHSKLYITGIIPEEKIDEYIENNNGNQGVSIFIKEEDDTKLLFQGIITNMTVNASMNVRSITIEALSASFLMDIKKINRSFQNKSMSYNKIFKKITAEYENSDTIDFVSNNKETGGLLLQYKETDWEFIKRLASHFYAPIIPAPTVTGLKYYIGMPNSEKAYVLKKESYSIKKDLKDYQLKSQNNIEGIEEQNLISYEITSSKILDLGAAVSLKDKTLYIYKIVRQIENGILVNKYSLRDKKGFKCPKLYNHALIGVSIFGKVLDVSKDVIKIHLEIDSKQSAGEAMWFPYSTVYSSSDGSGWYCMPEIGDKIRLYLPDENEKNAFTASSVNLNSSDPQKRSDPSVKSISTKYGKQVIFKKGAIDIIGGGQLLMRLTDDGGIEISSHKKISISAMEDIEINGGSKITIQGDEGIQLKQASANLDIADSVVIGGAKVNIE